MNHLTNTSLENPAEKYIIQAYYSQCTNINAKCDSGSTNSNFAYREYENWDPRRKIRQKVFKGLKVIVKNPFPHHGEFTQFFLLRL